MKVGQVNADKYIEIYDIKTIQSGLYELFYAFHKICEENGLIYNMYGGTLLGAVRHQGIIPWDDDVDVSMPREDYNKFVEIVKAKYDDEFIAYVYPLKYYPYPYMKFGRKDSILIEPLRSKYNKLSLYIDIFPIDGCSENAERREKSFEKLKRLKHKRSVCIAPIKKRNSFTGKISNAMRYCRYLLYSVIGYNAYLKKEIGISKQCDFKNSEYVCCMASSWFEKGVITKKEYLDRKLYRFGEYEFWGMRDYDRHLTNLYGNYMLPPPEKERVSNHDYHLYFEKKESSEEKNG